LFAFETCLAADFVGLLLLVSGILFASTEVMQNPNLTFTVA